MPVTQGDIITEIARKLHDGGMGDWGEAELRSEAQNAICQTVVMARSNKQDISVPMVADEADYSGEPCFGVTLIALGGQALDHRFDTDADMAAWSSAPPGVPTAWRQQSGARFRVSPTPDGDALGMIGAIEEAPTAGGTGYAVGDILDVTTGGTGGQVRVKAVGGSGVVAALELIMNKRETRGTGYTAAAGKATTAATGRGAGCTVEITGLAQLEVTGYSGLRRPPLDAVACTMNGTANTVTSTTHRLVVGDPIVFSGTGGGVTPGTVYYVVATSDGNTFQFSTAPGGTAFDISGDAANTWSDVITAIPEHFILPAVVPLGFAMALENRRTGTVNLDLATRKREEAAGWVATMTSALRLRTPT